MLKSFRYAKTGSLYYLFTLFKIPNGTFFGLIVTFYCFSILLNSSNSSKLITTRPILRIKVKSFGQYLTSVSPFTVSDSWSTFLKTFYVRGGNKRTRDKQKDCFGGAVNYLLLINNGLIEVLY